MKTNKTSPLIPLTIGLLLSASLVQAATVTWSGADLTKDEWNQPDNWFGNAVPSAGDDLVFGASARQGNKHNMPFSSFNSITFTNGGFTLTPKATANVILLVAGGGITNDSAVATINSYRIPTTLNGVATIVNNSIANLDFRSFITNQGNLLTTDGSGPIIFQPPSRIIGNGGLTKNGSGTLTLNGTNTYSGLTTVNGGQLAITTVHAGGGAFTVADNAQMRTTLSAAGAILKISTLTLGTSAGSTTNEFAMGLLAAQAIPVVYATNLNTVGPVYVNVSGSGLAVGSYKLIRYDGGTLAGTFLTNSLPSGVSGYISNNTVNPLAKSIDFVVTSVPSLRWTGQTNGVAVGRWDINGTSNWVDTSSSQAAFFVNGLSVTFDDTGLTNVVTVAANVSPFDLVVTNSGIYTFTNAAITNQIQGSARLTKDGTGTLVLGMTNAYSGFTDIKNGTLKLAANEGIGNGSSVTNASVLDLNGFTETIDGLNGGGMVTNSSTAGGLANTLTIGSSGGSGTFTGQIDEGPGVLTLVKTGAGTQKLSGNNDYSGGTMLVGSAGTLQLGGNNVLGSGPLTISAVTGPAGGLTPDSATPRSLSNDLKFITGSGNITATLGAPGAGLLTLSGNITLTNANLVKKDVHLNCNSDVLLFDATIATVSTNNCGISEKFGIGTLTFKNMSGAMSNQSPLTVRHGAMVFDGSSIDVATASLKVGTTNISGVGLAVITNGSAISATGLKIGDTQNNGAPLDSTNRVEVYNATLDAGIIQMGYYSQRAILSAHAGSLIKASQIAYVFNVDLYNNTEVNLDGATLEAKVNAPTFMEGLTVVNVHSGGVTIDSSGRDLTILQNLLEGSGGGGGGGLTKIGSGELILSGASTYTGATVVSNGTLRINGSITGGANVYGGTLGGGGTITGPVTIASGGTLAPGASIGTLTVNNTVALQGTTVMEISRDSGIQSDLLSGVTSLTYGGTLVVTNIGTTALSVDDTFNLFDASSFVPSSFANIVLPPEYTWDTSQLSVGGTIKVTGLAPSGVFNPPTVSAGNLVWTGSGFTPNGTYSILTSPNVADPVSTWTTNTTGTFDGSGVFSNAIPIGSNPQSFFLLKTP